MPYRLSRILVVLALVALTPGGLADVYKTVDENGRITYSDQPVNESSQKMDLPDINTQPAPAPRPSRRQPPAGDPDIPTNYTVRITHPPAELQIQPDQRDLNIQVTTSPQLYSQHELRVTDNGEVLSGLQIQEITRGTHTFVASVYDANGRLLGQSAPVEVHVHRPTLNSPAR